MAKPTEDYTETSLLVAVRDFIRAECSYAENECVIEHDEEITIGTGGVLVIPGNTSRGPNHNGNTLVVDKIISVNVAVIISTGVMPPDRKTDVYLFHTTNLNKATEKVEDALDGRYEVINNANTLITAKTDSTDGFIHPLLWSSSSNPREVDSSLFKQKSAFQQGTLGLMRTISFTDARRIFTRSTLT